MAAASLAILKLDTRFPRLPGDIACKDSFARPVRLQTIAEASVDAVVSRNPEGLDLSAFEQAVQTATEPLITTSCGFMIYFSGPAECTEQSALYQLSIDSSAGVAGAV